MKWYKGIALRFALSINLMVLIAVFLLSALYLTLESNRLEKTLREEGIAVANTFGSAIGLSMMNKDYTAISPLAYAIISHPDVQYVIVRDASGRTVEQKGETESRKALLVERVPLLYFQKHVGEIEIAMKTDQLIQQRYSLFYSTLLVVLLISTASMIVSIFLSRFLTSPLKKLMRAVHMAGIGARNLYVEEKGPAEIAELAASFNRMVEKIQRYEERLEEEIRKATQSLREKIKRLEEEEEQLRQTDFHDFLTGLPNYRALKEDLTRWLDRKEDDPSCDGKLAVLFLDLDRFKAINDTLGHEFGDQVLKELSVRLTQALGDQGKVYRMGGDEFILILTQPGGMKGIREKAEQVLSIFDSPWIIDEYEIPLSVSIGISIYPEDGREAEELIRHADTAMYRVKTQGKRGISFYTPSPDDPSYERIILESDLHKGIAQGEFEVYYQPKMEISSGKISGLEALLRWHHPKKGLLKPDLFIPLAEETGLILPLGEMVLHQVCEQGALWRKKGYPPIVISINLSTRQFMHSNLVGFIEETLKETGFPPECLELEITESVMADMKQGGEILKELKRIGVRISIDDFGTGYSSLSYLQYLPIDRLKIDHSFLEDISVNPKHKAIVAAMIALAKNLSLKVTAEGVEKEEQVALLRKYGCDELQGYYVSAPLSVMEIEERFLSGIGNSSHNLSFLGNVKNGASMT